MSGFERRFEWFEAKAEANLAKHGVSFETATAVFRDPNLLVIPDRVDEEGEQRWHAIGAVAGRALLLVVHVYRRDEDNAREIIRIISAREASKRERRIYVAHANS